MDSTQGKENIFFITVGFKPTYWQVPERQFSYNLSVFFSESAG